MSHFTKVCFNDELGKLALVQLIVRFQQIWTYNDILTCFLVSRQDRNSPSLPGKLMADLLTKKQINTRQHGWMASL